jgi:hypothetical protein
MVASRLTSAQCYDKAEQVLMYSAPAYREANAALASAWIRLGDRRRWDEEKNNTSAGIADGVV